MALSFTKQVVWITGASSGIGEALACEFYKQGAIVALSARRKDRLEALQKKLGDKAHVFPCDVQKSQELYNAAKKIGESLGAINIVVANAGYGVMGPFEKIEDDMWRKQMDTNFFGVIWTIKAALPYLKKTKGSIGIVSSVAGKINLAQSAPYSASKAALMALANSLYQELYPHKISVTNLAPGLIESEINQVNNWGEYVEKKRPTTKKAWRWPSQKAAKVMVKAIKERKREVVITGHGKLAAFLGTHLSGFTYWTLAKFGAKAEH